MRQPYNGSRVVCHGGKVNMPVIVITKQTWKWILIIAVLALIAILILTATSKNKGESSEEAAAAAQTMAEIENYELSVLPLRARELPVYNVQREEKIIALTIDAAWDTDKTEFILKLLKEENIKATFFLCGVWVKAYPDYVKQLAAEGHVIGNHSLSHPHMNKLTAEQIRAEISDLDDIIEELTGQRCTLFRAPYGEYNNTVVQTVREMGYEIVQWNRDTVDWKESRSASDILNAVLPKLASGDIILSHNNGFKIKEYLPVLIQSAKEKGYTFVTIPELLLEGSTKIDANGTQVPAG